MVTIDLILLTFPMSPSGTYPNFKHLYSFVTHDCHEKMTKHKSKINNEKNRLIHKFSGPK